MRKRERTIPLAEARRIIADCQIRFPEEIDLPLIAARYNVLVEAKPMKGAEGRLVRKGNAGVISVQETIREPGRKRFAVAHELGHFFLHPETRQLALCSAADMNRWSHRQQDEESEANTFAAELLLPQDIFLPRIQNTDPGFDVVGDLAGAFRTSLTATAIQYVKCTQEPCILISSAAGQWKWFYPNEGFATDFWIREDRAIHPYTCAHELRKQNGRQLRAGDVPAGAWLRGYDPDSKETVTEDSVFLTHYDQTLTLVWISEAM